ncbi:hypothetical protein JL722_12320 [Aureococcus anophagefferens]|nr:hypothetical protein JL722_12320 [Aureococcus anophagefferens]
MASARTPLLAAPRRDGIGKRAATALAVAAVAGLGLVGNGYGTAPLLALARRDAVNEGFEAALLSPGETVVAPLVAVETWACGGRGDAVAVEEHYLAKRDGGPSLMSGHIFLKQAYTYWRYGLCGPRASARAGQAARRAYGVPRASLQRGVVGDLGGAATALDTMCVYQYTPDIVKRSTLLRALFAYGKPLVLVLAGDSACRLELPATHHAVVLANGGAPSADLWFPEGLEGLENPKTPPSGSPRRRERGEAHVGDARGLGRAALPLRGDERQRRKPSRQALVTWLRSGGASELEALATKAGLAVRFNSTVVDMPRTSPTARRSTTQRSREDFSAGSAPGFAGDGASVFALAPAGDTWTSGRVLEALLTGAIPVAYRDELEAYLRGSLLGLAADRSAAAATTACATTPLAPGDRDGQLAAEAAYYGRDWYGSFVDTSALYTSGCSQTMHTQPGPDGTPEVIAQKYAHCYDAACAPPSVAAFSCAEV